MCAGGGSGAVALGFPTQRGYVRGGEEGWLQASCTGLGVELGTSKQIKMLSQCPLNYVCILTFISFSNITPTVSQWGHLNHHTYNGFIRRHPCSYNLF